MNNTSLFIINNNVSNASSIGGIKFVKENMPIILPYIILNLISSLLGIIGL